MSNSTYIGRNIRSFDSSPQFDGYSRVIITVSDEIEYSAGTELGRTLRLTCPWGTQEMAENILSDIRGFQYQPYTAEGAILDPAVELGDGITANNVYGGIYTKKLKFGPKLTATVSAPEDEELEHEYPYVSKQERTIVRNKAELKSQLAIQADRITAEVSNRESAVKGLDSALTIQADRITAEVNDRQSAVNTLNSQLTMQANQISAKVSKTGGSASSFGWVLDDSSWTIIANSTDILKATKNGLEVYGKITATSGKIGGFTIDPNSLSYNNQTWGGTNSNGIYIGPSGIQLGRNFKVDAAGNLSAVSGTFSGAVYAGNIQYGGGGNGTLPGWLLTYGSVSGAQIGSYTISTANLAGGINTSLGRADWAYGALQGWNIINNLGCYKLTASTYVTTPALYISSWPVSRKIVSFLDGNGSTRTIQYWGW